MLVNVLTRYPPPPTVLGLALVQNDIAFGAHSMVVATRYLRPSTAQNVQAFGANAVDVAPKVLGQALVENAHAFGAPDIHNLATGVRHLVATKAVNTNRFGTAQVRVSHRYLVQVGIANSSQFGAANVRHAIRLATQSRIVNVNQFGAPSVATVTATAVSAILPSGLDTVFVNSDGTARSVIAGGAFVNLDG